MVEGVLYYWFLPGPKLLIGQDQSLRVGDIAVLVQVELPELLRAQEVFLHELGIAKYEHGPMSDVGEICLGIGIFLDHVLHVSQGVSVLPEVLLLEAQKADNGSHEDGQSGIHFFEPRSHDIDLDEEVVDHKEYETYRDGQ